MSDVFGAGQAVSGVAQATAMVAVAALQYRTWQSSIDKADRIAQRIQDRADENHQVWKEFYYPKELATVNEITAEPVRTVSYGAVRQRVEAQYRGMLDTAAADALFCVDNQCAGARCDISREMSLRSAGLTAYGVEASIRAEEARVELLNRQRRADRLAVLAHGRQVHHNSTAALQGATSQYQFAAQQAAGAFNGAVASLGALSRRREQMVTRSTPAPVESRDIIAGNPMAMADPRADENGYGAFPQAGSGDVGTTSYFQNPDYDLPTLGGGVVPQGSDPGTGGPSASTQDTADYGGSI